MAGAMRVALVSPYDLDVAGGVQSHVLSLATALRAGGDEVVVVGPGSREEGRLAVGGSLRVPANGSRAPIALAPIAAVRVRRALRRWRPDIVHVHEPLVPLIGPAACLSGAAPLIVTFHAYAEAGPLVMLYRTLGPIGRRIVRRAAAMTAVSEVAADFHARALTLHPTSLEIVPNGVDVARFSVPGDAALVPRGTEQSPTILFVGRFEPRKGVDVAVRAFALLAAERPTLRLQLVGDGPQAGAVTGLIDALPDDVRRRVVRLGRVSNAALPAVLAQAALLIVPSRGGESFGIVLLEAMAAGTPLVASDLAGYRAVARDGREALLVVPDDPLALATAAARVLDEPDLRAGLIAAGRIRAVSFDWVEVAASTRRIYSRVLAGEGSRPGHD
jgi:phosphatidylinositol alpha-mannosyltransferase